LQTCFWRRDYLGVPKEAYFDRLECDGVGSLSTDINLGKPAYYAIEFIADYISPLNRYQVLLKSKMDIFMANCYGANRIYPRYNGEKYFIATKSLAEYRHVVFEVIDNGTSVTVNSYGSGSVKYSYTKDYDTRDDVNIVELFYELYGRNDSFSMRLFNIHTEPQDPQALYDKAVRAGLLEE
jgi:hypothetical protein